VAEKPKKDFSAKNEYEKIFNPSDIWHQKKQAEGSACFL
jgi:hypothetical protein